MDDNVSMRATPWEALRGTTQGQEEIIRRMQGFDRMAWLGGLTGGARAQVRYAVEAFTPWERDEWIGGGSCVY